MNFKSVFNFLIYISFIININSQNFTNVDTVYDDRIRSVKLENAPFLQLRNGDYITIEFDYFDDNPERLYYKIENCNADWTTSSFFYNDYMEGFEENEIDNQQFVKTDYHAYYHFEVTIPNNDIMFLRSGNYLIHIYDRYNDQPLITRRLVVYEELVDISITPVRGQNFNKNHAFEVEIDLKNIRINNPKEDVSMTLLQNRNWYNALQNVKSDFLLGDKLRYNSLSLEMPAGKEIRTLDARYLEGRGRDIATVTEYVDGWEVTKSFDKPMKLKTFFTDPDLNGNYFFEDGDRISGFGSSDQIIEYVDVSIALENYQLPSAKELFVVGGFNNWQCLPEYQMKYVSEEGYWEAYFKIKQGLYDYTYALRDVKSGDVEYYAIDDSWYETENEYYFIVYQKTYEAASYDRVLKVVKFEN